MWNLCTYSSSLRATDESSAINVALFDFQHTDVNTQNGVFPSSYPCMLGHEGSGTVIAVGEGVTRTKVGDKALLSFSSCQNCKVRSFPATVSCKDTFVNTVCSDRNPCRLLPPVLQVRISSQLPTLDRAQLWPSTPIWLRYQRHWS